MAKRVQKPKGLEVEGVTDVYSVSGCVNDDFAEYIEFWKHNKFWLFDSPRIIQNIAQENGIDLKGTALFYYEVYEKEFDGEIWKTYKAEESFLTNVNPPITKSLEGYDVVTFYCGNAPEHSPLSCNGLARKINTNTHCLLESWEEAFASLETGKFKQCEPGPYRIFAVYSVPWEAESKSNA